MAMIVALTTGDYTSCNGCTHRDERKHYSVASTNIARGLVLSYCESCLNEIKQAIISALG